MFKLHASQSLVAAAACCLTVTASAAGQATSSPPPNTITVTGSASVKPAPEDKDSNASIISAVTAARQAATPLALEAGKQRAAELASLTGLKLGSLISLSEGTTGPYGYFSPFGADGTFGPSLYCGTIRSSHVVTTKAGKKKRVFTSRRGCRVPPRVFETLTLTFAASSS